jgi:CubicO group peptidase (beta-lactamase class C family)
MGKIRIIIIGLIITQLSFGQKSSLIAFIDSLAIKTSYNGTILVAKNGEEIFSDAFGMANFQFNVPNKIDTRFRICSITKLFTSVLILKLYDEGKIDLNDTIGAYLPDYKGEGVNKISISQLLTATSGLEINEGEENGSGESSMYFDYYSIDEIIDKFCSGKLINQPGEKWNYNNADYIILGKIIENISKKSFEEVLSDKILIPLSMTNSGMNANYRVINNLAFVYQYNQNSNSVNNDPDYYIENYYAAGAMYSNTEDLLKFSNALFVGNLLKDSSLEKLMTPYRSSYGFGLWIYERQVNNSKILIAERQGSIWGATTRLLYLPEMAITIILLTNLDRTSLDDFQSEIMKKLIN